MNLELSVSTADIGREMHRLMAELYPICRSITGHGVRLSLNSLRQHIPLEIHEVPTATTVFDWTIPKEWNIKDAYVKNSDGHRIIDFNRSNLHVLNYSVPFKGRIRLEDLKSHLFTLPDLPESIPYRTSYYKETWGFCMAHKDFLKLEDGEYDVLIDSSLEPGHLSYGEYFIQGKSDDEILLTCHICHPSLCNDNLSGIALATFLAKELSSLRLRYSYRFLFIPGTIGSITWLARNEERVSRIKHGLVLACVGDSGKFTYKKSRRGDAEIDRAALYMLKQSGQGYDIDEFSPYGYDERQFCSPGFNLPVGCFMRTPHGRFPEYHTSADDLEFVRPEYLAESFSQCFSVLKLLEGNQKYMTQNPKCEPQLGKRGLYQAIGGQQGKTNELAMLWVLNYSDGNHTLLDIADRSGLNFDLVKSAADMLSAHDLLRPC